MCKSTTHDGTEHMQPGVSYIVTAPSKKNCKGGFQCGDRIWKDEDGSIFCFETQGWMSPCDVADATEGVTVKADIEWVATLRKRLEQQLERLKRLKLPCV